MFLGGEERPLLTGFGAEQLGVRQPDRSGGHDNPWDSPISPLGIVSIRAEEQCRAKQLALPKRGRGQTTMR